MNRRLQHFFVRVGLFLGGLFLLNFWLTAILALQRGWIFAYENYWGAPIGTITLFILLMVLTPWWLWALFRLWNWTDRPR